MANLEKHPKRVIEEWLFAEESLIPTHSRSPHVIGLYIKNQRREKWGFRPRFIADAGKLLIWLAGERPPAELRRRERRAERRHKLSRRGAQVRLPFGLKRTR